MGTQTSPVEVKPASRECRRPLRYHTGMSGKKVMRE